MAIVRLALANPAANTNTLVHTATRQSLVSVISTNTASATAEVDVWVQPVGASASSQYAYFAKDTILPGNNSLETFRFALETDDAIYVRSSTGGVSFSLNAIYESSGNQNIVTVSASAPNAPNIGDVWVDSDAVQVNFWDGSDWTSAVGGAAGYPQDEEPVSPAPTTGTMWLDTDGIADSYPAYPTVIYSPNDPSASLTFADVGTIWVDEDDSNTPVSTRWRATATEGQTEISGEGENGMTLSYEPGYEQLFINGFLLTRTEDYIANNGTSIIMNEALSAGDAIQIIAIDVIEISDTYTQAQVDSLLASSINSISASVTAIVDEIINPFLLAGM